MSSNVTDLVLNTETNDTLPTTLLNSAKGETKTQDEKTINEPIVVKNHLPEICQYYLRGACRFGARCRFLHNMPAASAGEENASASNENDETNKPSTANVATNNRIKNWADAPVFVPNPQYSKIVADNIGNSIETDDASAKVSELYSNELPCSYAGGCSYALCEMCNQYCLDPEDMQQQREHKKECVHHHEQEMELSFAIARSKDKICSICFDAIMEKNSGENRFGILPNCCHTFCLQCIRKWRNTKELENTVTRACPECRVSSDFVCPSPFWVESKGDKDKLLNAYRSALGLKDCKYFRKGEGKCPFGNKCFYKHALPNGEIVDVGRPRNRPTLSINLDMNLIDLFDDYIWDSDLESDLFDFLSNDDSEDVYSDWSDF